MSEDLNLEQAPQLEPEDEPGKKQKPEQIIVYVVDGFMVMFTALAMILLAFFIMLNAMAVQDDSRQRNAIGSLLGAFGILPEGVGVDESGAYVAEVEYISLRDESVLFAAFEAYVEEESMDEDVEVFVDEEGRRRIRFNDAVLFGSSSSRFHPRIIPLLDRLSAMLRKLDRSIEVEGHTDFARGRVSNWRLSAQRAGSIVRYFERAGNLRPTMLTAVGFGDTRPLDPANPEDPRNRRVEVVSSEEGRARVH